MPDLDSGVQTVVLEGPRLTAQQVTKLTQDLQATHTGAPRLIDCQNVNAVTPAGLSALIELGAQLAETPATRGIALAGLSRALLQVALDVGLAAHFAIYESAEAFARAQARAALRTQAEPQRCAL
jgi:ABC-type transporter Mla MlaB component